MSNAILRDTVPPNPRSIDEIIVGDPDEVTELELDGRGLETLPGDIGRLRNLQRLSVGGNALTNLPDSLGDLTRLAHLSLWNTRIAEWPSVLDSLPALEFLHLAGNPLGKLPATIARLRTLESLHVAGTKLTRLPIEIADLPIKSLGIDWVEGAGALIASLPGLAHLAVSGIPSAALPDEVARAPKLRRLSIFDSAITALPRTCAWAGTLEELNIWNTQLAALPEWLGQPPLSWLDVSSSRLSDLPIALGRMPDDAVLLFDDNPFREPLASIAELGDRAIRAYLRGLQRGGLRLREGKLVLVGEGNVGKSTLVAALRGEKPQAGKSTTHGIELGVLPLDGPEGGPEMTLNTWDFGGQEVYRITHQFFFSRDAVYLLLWHPRRGTEDCAVEDWLRRLRLRVGPTARVIVVATHASDNRRAELDWQALRHEFGDMLVDHVSVDSLDGTNLDCLKRMIAAEAAKLPQMGGQMPASWLGVRDGLLALRRTKTVLNMEAYRDLCGMHGLDDKAQAQVLLTLLHGLGHIVHYAGADGLDDLIVLDPEWLTKAISYVLEDAPTAEAGGILDHARLAEIWGGGPDRERYEPRFHPFFLRLMEQFDISYRLDEKRSLVAQMLPLGRPVLPWDGDSPLPEGRHQLRMICEMEDEAPGLVPWTIVRNHRFSTGIHWRSGAFLAFRDYESDALIELLGRKRLLLTVRGPSPDHFFALLKDGLETLIRERWPGLKWSFRIPCPGKDGHCDGLFDLDALRRRREKAKPEIDCHSCDEPQDVSLLLTGFATPGMDVIGRLDRMERRLVAAVADRAFELRLLLRGLMSEAMECPPLFSLTPENRKAWDPRRAFESAYRLTLWCTHPGHEHPVSKASYVIPARHKWLQAASPYLSFAFKALRLIVPIGDAALLSQLDSATADAIRDELALMDKVAEALPEGFAASDILLHGGGRRMQGAELRGLAELLAGLDPERRFGGLARVQDKATGDIHWVCPEHRPVYDPPLPRLT